MPRTGEGVGREEEGGLLIVAVWGSCRWHGEGGGGTPDNDRGKGEMEGEERGKIWCKKEEGGENEQHYVHRQDLRRAWGKKGRRRSGGARSACEQGGQSHDGGVEELRREGKKVSIGVEP
jgi:hypothetical protein